MRREPARWRTSLLMSLAMLVSCATSCARTPGCPQLPTPPTATQQIIDQAWIEIQSPELVVYIGELEALSAAVKHENAEALK